MRNMRAQLGHVVRETTAYGQSKHSEKGKGAKGGVHHDGRSYSYSTTNARLDTAKQFGKWMEVAHPEIERATNIRASHINEFLEMKSATCRAATLESYASNLRAITKEIETVYHRTRCDINEIITPASPLDKARTMEMERPDIEKLHKSFKADSLGWRAISLEIACGARVEGLTKLTPGDISIISPDFAQISIHGEKGGRDRVVDVRGSQNIERLERIKDTIPERERICPVKPQSLNRSICRHLQELGLKEKYPLTSVHAMRKAWAQNTYDQYRQTHTKLETVQYVNEQLGHSAERDQALLDRYVGNCW